MEKIVNGRTTYLHIDGFLYYRHSTGNNNTIYWRCSKKGMCTNNPAEGWNNRFQHMVGKFHPSFYKFLVELQKEQACTETTLAQLRLGQGVRWPQTPKSKVFEERIQNIVQNIDEYENYDECLKHIACNIRL